MNCHSCGKWDQESPKSSDGHCQVFDMTTDFNDDCKIVKKRSKSAAISESPKKVNTVNHKVRISTDDGKQTIGDLNVNGFDRLSDFLQSYDERYYILYNIDSGNSKSVKFISLSKVTGVEPIEEK